ncbi:MAG: B12-binding domain-containing radical SAM protein, partial [Planctomycetota bacterium]
MKILLINPPIREWAKPNCFPSGLGYLSSVLVNAGYEVEVLDINGYRYSRQEVEAKIEASDADVFGVGGLITVYKYIKWLTQVIKRYHPNKIVIGGGSSASSIPRTFLERTEADVAVMGEGENTVVELMQALKAKADLKGLPGIWYNNADSEIVANPARPVIKDLDNIPFPAWDLFPMDIYLRNPVGAPNISKWEDGGSSENSPLTMNVLPSRGCPYECIYCYHDFMGVKYRHRSAQNILDEIAYLVEHYSVNYIHFTDDDFVINRKHVMNLCDLLIKSGLNIPWGSTGRVNLMTEELLAKMA